MKVSLQHWPKGYKANFYGFSEWPLSFIPKAYATTFTSAGPAASLSFTVPTNATPGYVYQLHAYRTDAPSSALDIYELFQVCTLKSSRASVKHGGAVRLSGVIPTRGHTGSTAGKVKYVTLYRRTTSVTAAPTVWDATKKGWTRVGTIRANGLGKYVSGYLRPGRTTWYVVRYPGDDYYWDAYTSVLKVRVY